MKVRPVCPQQVPDIGLIDRNGPSAEGYYWRLILPFLEKQQEDCLSVNIYVPIRGEILDVS